MPSEPQVIDSWEKWKECFPNVPWDSILAECEANKYDISAIGPMIDRLQEYGIPFGVAKGFVIAALDILYFL